MTLELDFAEADEVESEAVGKRGVPQTQAEWLDAFYRNASARLLNIYDRSRLGTWRIHDREQAAAYWMDWTKWFEEILQRLERSQQKVVTASLPEIPALRSAVRTVTEIVEACRASYELHS